MRQSQELVPARAWEFESPAVYHIRRCRNGYTSRFQKPTPKGMRVDYLFGRIEEKCPNVEVLDISKKTGLSVEAVKRLMF